MSDCASLRWHHNGRDSVSNRQSHECLLHRLFRLRSKKTSKFRVTGLCEGNSPMTGEFPAQRASNAENVSIWWRRHVHKIYFSQQQNIKLHRSLCPMLLFFDFAAKKLSKFHIINHWRCYSDVLTVIKLPRFDTLLFHLWNRKPAVYFTIVY